MEHFRKVYKFALVGSAAGVSGNVESCPTAAITENILQYEIESANNCIGSAAGVSGKMAARKPSPGVTSTPTQQATGFSSQEIDEDVQVIEPTQEEVLNTLFGRKVSVIKKEKFCTKDAFNKPTEKNPKRKHNNSPPPQDLLNMIYQNQFKILENQKNLNDRIDDLKKELREKADNCVVIANSQTCRETKVLVEMVRQSLIKLTGEEENELHTDIAATLPLSSIDAAQDVEDKLKNPEYLVAMKSYMYQLKGLKGTVDDVLKKVMTDELIAIFNFDGRKEKRALVQLTLINNLLSDVFAAEGRNCFEKEIKKSVELSHNRFKQKRFHAAKQKK